MSKKENANDKMGKWMTGISNMGLAPKPKAGCEFCNEKSRKVCVYGSSMISENELRNEIRIADGTLSLNYKINYCPMCGRKLEDPR